MLNRSIKINEKRYIVMAIVGDYYKCKAVSTPHKTFDDGVEVEFSHPHWIFYNMKIIDDYVSGERKYLL